MKTVLVTGGSRGLGELIVNAAILNGYFVVFTYNKNKKKSQKIYYKNNRKCLPLKLDLNNPKSISKLYKTLKDKKIKIDFLINNAAIKPNRIKFYKLKNSEILKIFNINVISVFEMINKFFRQINKKRFVKKIINISSYSSKSGGYKISHYASSKSALENLTLSLSKELFDFNIGIYCISPYKILINKSKKNQINNSKIVKMIMGLIKKNNIKNSGKIFYIK
jgi:3-oxoacyl-[acyl-carrier protein] reductase